MKTYKIQYKQKDLNNWVNYDNVIYNNYDNAKSVMEDAQEQFPHIEFKINNID